MKCSSIGIRKYREDDGSHLARLKGTGYYIEWVDVQKDPVTDSGKKSKAGRVTLWKSGGEYLSAVDQPNMWTDRGTEWTDVLEEVYRDGRLIRDMKFDEVRANSNR